MREEKGEGKGNGGRRCWVGVLRGGQGKGGVEHSWKTSCIGREEGKERSTEVFGSFFL